MPSAFDCVVCPCMPFGVEHWEGGTALTSGRGTREFRQRAYAQRSPVIDLEVTCTYISLLSGWHASPVRVDTPQTHHQGKQGRHREGILDSSILPPRFLVCDLRCWRIEPLGVAALRDATAVSGCPEGTLWAPLVELI